MSIPPQSDFLYKGKWSLACDGGGLPHHVEGRDAMVEVHRPFVVPTVSRRVDEGQSRCNFLRA